MIDSVIRWADLTPLEQAEFGNGCGPAFFPDWLISWLFGWFFEASCRRHDFGYARGGSRDDRKVIDVSFFKAMKGDAQRMNHSILKQLGLMLVAVIFYMLVRAFGWLRFSYGPYATRAQLFNVTAVG